MPALQKKRSSARIIWRRSCSTLRLERLGAAEGPGFAGDGDRTGYPLDARVLRRPIDNSSSLARREPRGMMDRLKVWCFIFFRHGRLTLVIQGAVCRSGKIADQDWSGSRTTLAIC